MTIQELVDELKGSKYTSDDKKIEYLKKHLKTDYIVYEEKTRLCKQILLTAMFVKVDDKNIYKPNTPLKYETTIFCYLQTYFEFDLNEEFLKDFNILEQNKITELLLRAVGDDVNRFNTVLSMMEDDLVYDNSLVPYLETKVEAMDIMLNSLKNTLETINTSK